MGGISCMLKYLNFNLDYIKCIGNVTVTPPQWLGLIYKAALMMPFAYPCHGLMQSILDKY